MSSRSRKGQVALWVFLYFALAMQTYWYITGTTFYGAYLHWSGQISVYLLFAALAVTPLQMSLRSKPWVLWLVRRRRDIGVASFVYAAAHTIAYWQYQDDFRRILADSADPAIFTGWIAFSVFFLLALTSNDVSVQRMQGSWKSLHKSVYPAAVLTAVHWIMTAFDPTAGYVALAAVVVLLMLRRLKRDKGRPKPF